jgi:hypothetical protein
MKSWKLGLLAMVGLAIQIARADSWPNAKISKIVMDETSTGANCPVIRFVNMNDPASNLWITLNSPNAQKYLAVALTAMSLGKQVEIQYQLSSEFTYNGKLTWIAITD